MPVTSVLIGDVNRYITEGIRSQLTRDVARSLKLPELDRSLRHSDNDKVMTDSGSNVGSENISSNIDNNTPTTSHGTQFIVTVSNEMDEDDIATAAIHQRSAYPIFRDSDVGVEVTPMYIKETYKLDFKYTTSSKTEAVRLYDRIRIGITQTRNILIHKFQYNIPIPPSIEDFICDVYDLKSRLYDIDLESYFIDNSSSRIHLITDMSNPENKILAVNEVQKRVVGRFDFSPLPSDIENNQEDNLYSVEFGYEVTIETPRAMVLRYPVMICNRPIPNKYIDFIKNDKDNEDDYNLIDNRYMSQQGDALAVFESNRQGDREYLTNQLPVNIPNYDEFIPGTYHKGYLPLMSVLVEVDESDKKTLFNLRDLDPYGLEAYVLDHLVDYGHRDCTYPYNSFLYISLCQDGTYFDAPVLEIDQDLNVRSVNELSLVKPVRVLISFLYDIAHLNITSLREYMRDRELIKRLVGEYVRILSDYKEGLNKNRVDIRLIHRVLFDIVGTFISDGNYAMAKELLDEIAVNRAIYASALIMMRDKMPADIKNLKAKGVIPNVPLDRLEHYDIAVENDHRREPMGSNDDNLIFIFPHRKTDEM